MTFAAPIVLLGLLVVPLAALAYVFIQRRRSRYAVRFTNVDLLANLVDQAPGWRRHVPPVLYLAAIAALALALGRPHMTLATPREEATIVLTMDVSASMRATDVEPTRMVAAQEAAKTFVDGLPDGIRVGIVSFADRAHVLVAPTADAPTCIRRSTASTPTAGRPWATRSRGRSRSPVRSRPPWRLARTPPAAPDASADPDANGAPDATADPDASTAPGADGEAVEDPLVAIVLLSDGANTQGEAEPIDVAHDAAAADVPITTVALGTAEARSACEARSGSPRRCRSRRTRRRSDRCSRRAEAGSSRRHRANSSRRCTRISAPASGSPRKSRRSPGCSPPSGSCS